MPFVFTATSLPGLLLIEPQVFSDDRGWFLESYKNSDFFAHGIKENFVQDNHSRSIKNVIRGLHYQRHPNAQGKLVRCTKGKILDVAVDLRKGSPSYGEYYSQELSEENKLMLYVPVGFAHGFLTLSDEAEIQYKNTAEYHPASDGGIRFDDKRIGIQWPVPIADVILSEKDNTLPSLDELGKDFGL